MITSCYILFTYVLLAACSVGVLVGLRGEEIHLSDPVEEGLVELSSNASLREGGKTLNGGDKDESEDNGVGLHDFDYYLDRSRNYDLSVSSILRKQFSAEREGSSEMSQKIRHHIT